jgi:DNA-directed RNA polymerase specialized sigma24 family protein
MSEPGLLADQFEHWRPHLASVAYGMLGSVSEAEDAVQQAWLRLRRSDADAIIDLRAWLTTVVGRICLDMLRARRNHRVEYASPPARQARRHWYTDSVLTRKISATWRASRSCSNSRAACSRTFSRRARPSALSPPPSAYRIHRPKPGSTHSHAGAPTVTNQRP